MKRIKIIGVLVLASVTWGTCFAKGGHASARAVAADRHNLVKARAAATASRAQHGDTQAQKSAAIANLLKARAERAAAKGGK